MTTLLTKKQLIENLKIEPSTLRRWKELGVPIVKKEKKEFFDLENVKDWQTYQRRHISELVIGQEYSNDFICRTFKCSGQGGMKRSHLTNSLVLFSNHRNSNDIYEDKKTIDDEGNKIILYTGSGQNGDQDINDKQNRVLNISNELSIKVYLFESYQIGKYIYQGEVYLSSSSYYEEQKGRLVCIFPLSQITQLDQENYIYEKLTPEIERQKEQQIYKLPDDVIYNQAKKVAQQKRHSSESNPFIRNRFVAIHVKKRAEGYCDLCNKSAPFNDRNGYPYLECHHVEWLSKGGEDSIDNALALDPNCHRKVYELNLESDMEIMIDKLAYYKGKNL